MYLNCIHTIKKVFVLLLIFSGIFFYAHAAAPDTLTPLVSYKHFGEEDGLHCKTVYEVIQDKDGFLWFATDAGAFRFDGKIFKQFNTENGVADNEVLKIFQDSYGRIWFLTLNGYFSFWKNGKIYNESNTLFLKKAYAGASIFSYFEDSKKRIWFGTPEYMYVVIEGDSVRHVKQRKDTVRGYLFAVNVHEDADGDIWTFGANTMFRFFDNQTTDTIQLPEPGYIACHGKDKTEMFYLANPRGGVYKIHDKEVSLYADSDQVPFDIRIINMVADEGCLWICTQGNGCYKIVNGKVFAKYLENAAVTSVFRDRENNLWFNTMSEGVYMLPATASFVKNYNEQSGLSANNITSFLADLQSGFWLGYKNGTVEKVENNKITTFKFSTLSHPSFNRVNSLTTDSGTIFCGTDFGAYVIHDNKTQLATIESAPEIKHYSVKQIFISDKKNIYVAHSGGLLQLIKYRDTFYAKRILDSSVRATALTQYPGSRLLVSITSGLMEYKEARLEMYSTEINFSSTRILDMKPAPGNLLVLATNGNGIYFLKAKKLFQHLTISEGLSDNNCKRIFISDNKIYVSTDKGLNILAYKNEKWAVSNIITTKNGLLSNTVNDVAEHNGIIYAATEKGLSLFNKVALLREKFVGRVYATEIVTDSVYATTDSVYRFKTDIPKLLIKFSYPVFDPSNNSKISYRLLHGKTDDGDWTSSENNEVEFSSLIPGQYIFQLKPDAEPATADGITNLYITILPMWWQTSGARIALVVLILVLVAVIIRAITRIQYRRELQQLALLEAERNRIASDMHDDIGADLTQLSVWSGILKSSQKKDTDALEKITSSSNDVLQKMDQIIWALNSFHNHTTDLISYLREYASQYLESAGINLLFKMPEAMPEFEVSAIEKRNIFLTLKELLHNTVKHSGARNVSISIHAEESILNVEYKDDGKGFTPREKENGMGNITVQNRMKEINSSIMVKSSPGKGFSAHLSIRLKKKLPQANQKIAE